MRALVASLFFLKTLAHAQTCDPVQPAGLNQCFREAEHAAHGPEIDCETHPQGLLPPASACSNRYNQIFSDGTLNVTYASGYMDSDGTRSDYVASEYWVNELIRTLTSPCPSTFQLWAVGRYNATQSERDVLNRERESCGRPQSYQTTCGFSRSDDPEILTKTVVIDRRQILIRIRVVRASLSTSDRQNRSSTQQFIRHRICASAGPSQKEDCIARNTPPAVSEQGLESSCSPGDELRHQICRSAYVRRAWRSSITNGDEMVFYDGHARDGGGPSFGPPRVNRDGSVDYNWYRRTRPGHDEEAKAFEEAVRRGRAPSIYSSLSCDSNLHFLINGRFPEVSPSTAYVMSNRVSYGDEGVSTFLSTLEGVVKKQCREELAGNISGASCAFRLRNF